MVAKTSYVLRLIGCDDQTMIAVELTPDEAELILKIAKLSQETSEYRCQPTMTITEGVLPESYRPW